MFHAAGRNCISGHRDPLLSSAASRVVHKLELLMSKGQKVEQLDFPPFISIPFFLKMHTTCFKTLI